MKKLFLLLTLLIGLVGFPHAAFAHGVQTDYSTLLSQFQFTSEYSSGEPFAGAPVLVYSPENPDVPWIEGTTDESGSFAFQPDPAIQGEWQVRIGDTGDHADILTIPVTQTGIEFDMISQQTINGPHWWMRQVGVATAAFSTGLGSVVLFRRNRWF